MYFILIKNIHPHALRDGAESTTKKKQTKKDQNVASLNKGDQEEDVCVEVTL